jgi:hypothetical protein
MSSPPVESSFKSLSVHDAASDSAAGSAGPQNTDPNPDKRCYSVSELRALTSGVHAEATHALPPGLLTLDLTLVPAPRTEKTRGSPRGSSPRLSPPLSPDSSLRNWERSPGLVPLGSASGGNPRKIGGDGFSLGGSQVQEVMNALSLFRKTCAVVLIYAHCKLTSS